MANEKPIAIDLIRTDCGTQTRAAINEEVVGEYAELLRSSKSKWPFREPVVLVDDGNGYILASGFHRVLACVKAKKDMVMAHVHKGTRHDALVMSLGSNQEHGLRRTNADKRHAVTLALADAELAEMSDRALAELCGVGHQLVAEVRKARLDDSSSQNGKNTGKLPKTRVGRDGRAINTEAISEANRKRASAKKQDPAAPPKISGGTTFNVDEIEAVNEAEAAELRASTPDTDQWGAEIQPHAEEAFKAVPRFDEILKLLREARRLYLHLPDAEGGQFLQSGSITSRSGWSHAGIINAIRDLEDAKPAHTICPYSVNENQKHGNDCTLCKGLNWIPSIPKNRVPERLIEKAKRSLNV